MKKIRLIVAALILMAAVIIPVCAQTATAPATEATPAVTVKVETAAAPAEEAKKTEAPAEAPAAADATTDEDAKSYFANSFWALVPPLFAIALALITKEVFSSLFLGIVLGSCFVANFQPLAIMDCIINTGLIGSLKGIAGIFVFLVELGVIVALISRSGATQAFGRWAEKHVKSRIGAQLSTFVLGVLIFIDDYFNCLTVGSVMMPVTDAKRVSRAKLAYLIDATAAPICMIAPVSSWGAAVSQYADGTEYTGLELFIRAIPYNFYSLLTFVFVLTIVFMKFDFGPMARHEHNAITTGDLITDGEETNDNIKPFENAKGIIGDMIIPVIVLIGICVFALVYNGGILDGKSFIDAFSNTDATVGLPWGGLIAMVFTMLYLAARGVIPLKKALSCIPDGFNAMVPALLILTFATGLKDITTALGAKDYIGVTMSNFPLSLSYFLPAIIFLVACVLSFSTGTSWGTFGILIPIVVSIFKPGDPLLFIGMSACLAGAVAGDHCSPISDTTIMASAGARCPHVNHVTTQLPYVLVVCGFSFVGFVMAPFINCWRITFPLLVVLMVVSLYFLKLYFSKKIQAGSPNIEVVEDK